MFVECNIEGGEKGQYLGDIPVDGKNMSIIECGIKAYLIDAKHKEEIDIGNEVWIEALTTESGKKELGIINEKNWKIERILETNKQNELNEARYLVNKASKKLSGIESRVMENNAEVKFVNLPARVKDLDELLKTKGIHISNEIIAKAEVKHKVSLKEIRTREIEQILTKSHEQKLTAKP